MVGAQDEDCFNLPSGKSPSLPAQNEMREQHVGQGFKVASAMSDGEAGRGTSTDYILDSRGLCASKLLRFLSGCVVGWGETRSDLCSMGKCPG